MSEDFLGYLGLVLGGIVFVALVAKAVGG